MYDDWSLTYTGTTFHLNEANDAGDTFFLNEPEWGTATTTNEDAPRPRSDGIAMGADYRGGRTVTFTLGVSDVNVPLALDKLARLERAWRGDSIRLKPGSVGQLACLRSGRQRAVYGRPRRIAPTGALLDAGYFEVVCDFATVDDTFYGLTVNQADLTPSATVTIAGELPAWPVVTFGPGTSPKFKVDGTTVIDLGMTVTGSVTVDTRPWRRTALDQDGDSVAGALARSTRLVRAGITPGSRTLSVTGGNAVVSWQSSHSSL